MSIDYIAINKASWNNKVEPHLKSTFYDQKNFMLGNTSLKEIEIPLLGDVVGKKILHLQCHFGQDSISLSRMGAEVTGVDFSDKAILAAKQMAYELDVTTQFICSDIYELPNVLSEQFDIVYTSYGTIGWLPDLQKWAQVIHHFLKPNGQFIFVDFHPVVWMFDVSFKRVAYNYFNTGPIEETCTGSYADRLSDLVQKYVMWNHGLAEVFQNILNQNMKIENFQEYNYSPYPCFQNTISAGENRYHIPHLGNKIPMVYSLVARANQS